MLEMILRLTLGRSLLYKIVFSLFYASPNILSKNSWYLSFIKTGVFNWNTADKVLLKSFFLFYDNDFCSCTNIVSNLLEKSLVWNYFTIIEIYTWCVQIEGTKIEPRGSLFKFEFTTWSCYYKNPYFRHNWALEVSYGCLKAIRWD